MRDYMDRRVTSPSWGPPPQCKQALNFENYNTTSSPGRFSLALVPFSAPPPKPGKSALGTRLNYNFNIKDLQCQELFLFI